MNAAITSPPPLPRRRPALVWVISLYYIFSAASALLSYALVYSGVIPMNDAQKAYFQSLTPLDHALTLVIVLANLAGAASLFFLRRHAFHFFTGAFTLAVLMIACQIIAKNWLQAIGGPGIIGAVFGWGISIAIIVYSRLLIKQGVLK